MQNFSQKQKKFQKKVKSNNMNPMIFEKTRDGEFLYDVYSRLIKDRIIFLWEEIDADVATSICATLLLLDHQNKDKPISLYLNSPGGAVSDGLFTIYDTMNFISAPVHTVCIGTAYSAAAFILAAGTKGHRKAFPNSEIMIHDAISGFEGSAKELEISYKRFDKLNNKLQDYLSKHTGRSKEEIKKVCERDFFLSPQEALEFGLIDEIVTKNKLEDDLDLDVKPVRSKKKPTK